jgi:hypothetical protein
MGQSRTNITALICTLGVLILLFMPQVGYSLFALIFLGMIPGTNLALPSWVMFFGSVIGIFIALRWIIHQPLYIGSHAEQEKLARQLARKKVLAMTSTPAAADPTPTRPRRINAVNRRHIVKI